MYFKDLLRYRQTWLGVALLWIILLHCPFDFGPFSFFQSLGYGGVDICLFASGIGCFYSLSKESDVTSFMKRRVKRLAPTYIIFIVIWLAYRYAVGRFGLQMALGNLLALQNFTGLGQEFNWYISAIFLLYILAPYFKGVIDRSSSLGRFGFFAFLILCSIPFWGADTYIITVTRLPIFYLGMLFADVCKKDAKITRKHAIGLAAAFLLGAGFLVGSVVLAKPYLWSHGLYWYPFVLITPPLCVGISCVARMLERIKVTKWLVSLVSLCGDYSFEVYLVHLLLITCIPIVIDALGLAKVGYLVWMAGVVALCAGCFILRRVAGLLTDVLSRCSRKTKQET